MINKIKNYKINKNVKSFIKFIFFLKYLILIFVLSTLIFLYLPKFYKFEERINNLKQQVELFYDIKITNYESADYVVFPYPRIVINNAKIDLKKKIAEGNSKSLSLVLNVRNLYNYDKESILKRIELNNSSLKIEIGKVQDILIYFNELNKKIKFSESNLVFEEKNNKFLEIKNFKLTNDKKGNFLVNGFLLKNELFVKYNNRNKFKKLVLQIPNIGLDLSVFFKEQSSLKNLGGNVKAKILDTRIMFDFDYKDKLKIYNSSLNNSLINSSFDGLFEFDPYFYSNIVFNFKKLKSNFSTITSTFKNIYIPTNYLKKINGKFILNYEEKKIFNKFIENLYFDWILENGEITINKSIIDFGEAKLSMSANILESEGYKKMKFRINLNSSEKIKFLKKFNINLKSKANNISIDAKGSLTFNSNKIFFESINIDGNKVTKEDRTYYKDQFEKLVIKENLFDLFDIKKIKKFIYEIE